MPHWNQRLLSYLGKSSNLGERQFYHVLSESWVVAFLNLFLESVTDTPSQDQVLQGAYHTTSQRQVRMRRSQNLLAKESVESQVQQGCCLRVQKQLRCHPPRILHWKFYGQSSVGRRLWLTWSKRQRWMRLPLPIGSLWAKEPLWRRVEG